MALGGTQCGVRSVIFVEIKDYCSYGWMTVLKIVKMMIFYGKVQKWQSQLQNCCTLEDDEDDTISLQKNCCWSFSPFFRVWSSMSCYFNCCCAIFFSLLFGSKQKQGMTFSYFIMILAEFNFLVSPNC